MVSPGFHKKRPLSGANLLTYNSRNEERMIFVNIRELDLLNTLATQPYESQRILAETVGLSVGAVNNGLKQLVSQKLLTPEYALTEEAWQLLKQSKPRNAVILAAGYGMRMVPINVQCPKAMVEVGGEPLIERQIRQLQEAGIQEIYIVVGFMKEQFDYLIDKYGVKLIVNPDYAGKNNLHSMQLAAKHLGNTYIIPSDIYCLKNPFRCYEPYSWYMVSDSRDPESSVRVNRKSEAVRIAPEEEGNAMLGISYLLQEQSDALRKKMKAFCADPHYDHAFWEEALFEGEKMTVNARVVPARDFTEINTYEQLRELDGESRQLRSRTMDIAAEALGVTTNQIVNIEVLKKGMTNNSFLFECNGCRYIMRIPGAGTDQLINRREEASVYHALAGTGICEDVLYINPENGYKVTRFFENARVCDPENPQEVSRCMAFLRQFHQQALTVDHIFDIFEKIEFYESLWNGQPSVFRDYRQTKEGVLELKSYIEAQPRSLCLTHIDAVPDNFLFYTDAQGKEQLCLIDWEYAALQDPHVDIAMFAIYALYDRQQLDALIESYFPEGCPDAVRKKIYCYVAACGLLWSNWCEYKRFLGVEFGEYSLRQYRYAKDFTKLAKSM